MAAPCMSHVAHATPSSGHCVVSRSYLKPRHSSSSLSFLSSLPSSLPCGCCAQGGRGKCSAGPASPLLVVSLSCKPGPYKAKRRISSRDREVYSTRQAPQGAGGHVGDSRGHHSSPTRCAPSQREPEAAQPSTSEQKDGASTSSSSQGSSSRGEFDPLGVIAPSASSQSNHDTLPALPSPSTPASSTTPVGDTFSASAESGGGLQEKPPEMKLRKALSSLDAYFEKLKPEPVPAAAAPERAAAAAAAASPASPSSAGGAGAAAAEVGRGPKGGDAAEEAAPEAGGDVQRDFEQLLRQILTDQGGKAGGAQGPSSIKVVKVGSLPSDYERLMNTGQQQAPPKVFSILLALNVAVFLFEAASPEAVPGNLTTSLPSLYGAKVNELILAGEWWRVITPMFLHAGPFHLFLGCTALGRLGASVELAYGPLAFLGAYFAGGVFGDLASFAFTPAITIGGTGPVYGLIGAWVAFLLKNRQEVGAPFADRVIRMWLLLGTANILLGSDLPIDDMNHYGGFLGGLAFGALAAPAIEIKRTATKVRAAPGQPPGGSTLRVDLSLVSRTVGNRELALGSLLLAGIAVVLYQLAVLHLTEGLGDITPAALFI